MSLLLTGAGVSGSLPVVPSDLPGLRLWLKADAITGATDGALLPTWTDSSGNGTNATQAVSGSQATYKTGIVNGQPVVRFGGSAFYSFTDAFSTFTAGEVFLVVKVVNDPALGDTTSSLWNFGTHASNSTHFPYSDGNIYEAFGTNTRKTVGNPAPSLASWRLYNVVSAPSDFRVALDGTQIFSTATNTVSFSSVATLGNGINTTFYLVGDVAELILYNRAISSAERAGVKAYVASKYGLTIA